MAVNDAKMKEEVRVQTAVSLAVRQKLDLLHRINGIEIHTGMESYTCMYCSKVFSDLRVLKSHLGMHTGERPFPCSHCQRCFKNKYQLRDHIRVHTGERPFQCPHCPKAFAQKNQLNLHLPTHNSERPFVCGLCGKSFKIATTLQTHLKFHSDERPYVCPVCQFAFHLPSLLRSHMRTHTGERPYPCKFCGKRFKTASTRKVHERSHEPEPAFKCPDCDRSFTYASNLAMHRRTHKEKEQHTCVQCSQVFITPDALRLHLEATHANSFKCSICKTGFSLKAQLEAHIESHKAEAIAFTCYHCHKAFRTQPEYRTHMSSLPCVKLYGCGKCSQRFETISQLNGHMWSHKPPRSNRRGRPPKRYMEMDMDKASIPEVPPLRPISLPMEMKPMLENGNNNNINNHSSSNNNNCSSNNNSNNNNNNNTPNNNNGLSKSIKMDSHHLLSAMDKSTMAALSAIVQLPITYEPRLFCGICFSEHANNEELQEHLRQSHPVITDKEAKALFQRHAAATQDATLQNGKQATNADRENESSPPSATSQNGSSPPSAVSQNGSSPPSAESQNGSSPVSSTSSSSELDAGENNHPSPPSFNRRMVHTVSSANRRLLQKYVTVSVSDDEASGDNHFRELNLPVVETSRRTKRLKQGWRGYIV